VGSFIGFTCGQLDDKSKYRFLLLQEQHSLQQLLEHSKKEGKTQERKKIELEEQIRDMKEKSELRQKELKKLKDDALKMRSQIQAFTI